MRRPLLFVALAATILTPLTAAAAVETPSAEPLLVVLEHRTEDSGDPADHVTALDPFSLAIVGKAPIAGDHPLALDRNARHLVAWGTGDISIWTGKLKEPAKLVISDLVDGTIDATFTLFKPPFSGMLDGQSGRYFAMNRSADETPATLIALDLVGRREVGRVDLGTDAEQADWERFGDLVYVLVGTSRTGRKESASRLLVYDAAAGHVVQEMALAPRPLGVFLAGDYAYVLCRGSRPKGKDPEPGKAYVFDAATHRQLAEHDVGFEPVFARIDLEEEALLVVAEGKGEHGPGTLTELRAHLARAQAAIPRDTTGFRLADEGETILLLASNGVMELRRRDLATIRHYRLPFEPRYVIVDAAHRRAFAGAEHGSDIAILDREKGTLVASMKTGRSGVKVRKGLLSALSIVAGAAVGAAAGVSTAYPLYWPGGTATAAALSPDAKRLFVVNVQTNDLTVIDTDEERVLDILRVGTRPYSLDITEGGESLWVLSAEHATRMDPRTLSQVDADVTVKEGLSGWPFLDSGSGRVFMPRESGIEVLSARDGSRIGMIEGLDHPVGISLVPRIAIELPDPAPVTGEALPQPE